MFAPQERNEEENKLKMQETRKRLEEMVYQKLSQHLDSKFKQLKDDPMLVLQ